LRGLHEGKTYKQIAADLYITVSTIRTHAGKIYDLLGVPNYGQAVILASENGWLRVADQGNGKRAGTPRDAPAADGSPMAQLQKMRDLQLRVRSLAVNRDRLILEALDDGNTQEAVARAAGLSQSRIWDIKDQDQSAEDGGETKPLPPLSQLRKMRDLRQRIEGLAVERDAVIREASHYYSERRIAEAVGLSSGRINRIKSVGGEG
jgi:DNA-directed RNA polymerase specialized sigma24 family protein